jgi:hypothetical protein
MVADGGALRNQGRSCVRPVFSGLKWFRSGGAHTSIIESNLRLSIRIWRGSNLFYVEHGLVLFDNLDRVIWSTRAIAIAGRV